jgi:hypothetical protein
MNWLFTYVEATVLTVCLLIISYVVACMSISHRSLGRAAAKALGIIAWFVAIFELAHAGVFDGHNPNATTALLMALGIPLVVGALWGLSGLAREFVSELPVGSLSTIQTYRLTGVVFFVALQGGVIPQWLGLWGGIGEMTIGVSAPIIGLMLARAEDPTYRLAKIWNVLGILELAALAIAVALNAHGSSYFLTLYPLVLFTVFILPTSIVLHLLSLTRIQLASQSV